MSVIAEDRPLTHQDLTNIFSDLTDRYSKQSVDTLIPLLPLLTLRGDPYTLTHHAPFEPLFDLRLPKRTLWKTGRQVSKTTGLASASVLQSAVQPYFATLFVAPRFEQIRRVSANYVKPFIENSILDRLIAGKSVERSVLQKTFRNESRMYFSFAFLDVDRIRGLSVDCVKYDEIQDIDTDFIPVIKECMSASKYGIEMFFGTPKTLDNTIQKIWEETSQAEWITRCPACNHENIPSLDFHLLKMIGPKGPICAKCGRAIQPRTGRWIHANPDSLPLSVSYHVPQIVMPMHYEDLERAPGKLPDSPSEKWLELLAKQNGLNNYTEAKFLNEVLGESCDVGTKLVTLTDIKQASVLNKNEEPEALRQIHKYAYRAMGVDWGGGGEEMVSYTVVTLVGLNPANGKLECFFTKVLHAGFSHMEEAREVMRLFTAFQCHYFCHDYGGSGSVREALMVQSGFPIQKILPFMYVRATVNKMVEAKKPGGFNQRHYYTLDKARSLVLQAQCIKTQAILLPDYKTSKDITAHLMALIEDKTDRPSAADVYLITRNAKMPDDFAHALNFACIGIWHIHRCYPDLSKLAQIKLTQEQKNFAEPLTQSWNEE